MKRYTIGVIINQIEGPFFSSHWSALRSWAEKKGVRLIFFTGKALNSPIEHELIHNFTYGFVKIDQLDGILVFSGSLGNYIEKNELREKIESWGSIPLVSINYPLEGYSSFLSESDQAIEDLVRHIVEDHGYNDIGLITGAMNNYDSRIRHELYISSLKKFGVHIPAHNIFKGNFTPESGEEAAGYFLKNGLPEAVLCSNDDMAHSFIETLNKNGIQVPFDVAVTGFDGYPYTKHLFPSLTTIEQPFTEMSEKAADLLYRKIDSYNHSQFEKIYCQLRIRQSCGCIIPEKEISMINVDENSSIANIPDKSQIIRNQTLLIDKILTENLPETIIHNDYISRISSLTDMKDKNELNDSIDTLKALYWMNSAATGQIQYKRTYNFFLYQWKFRNVSRRISSKLYFRDLLNELNVVLPELNLDFFRMYLFDRDINCKKSIAVPTDNLKLHLQFRKGEKSFCREDGKSKTINDIFDCPESIIIKTLFFGEKVFGFIQIGLGNHFDMLYESLREVISNSLQQAIINKKMQDAQRKLEFSLTETRILNNKFKDLSIRDAMTSLLNRRGFFEMSKDILEKSQNGDSFYMIYMDLDGLKKINDTFGHNQGDWAICNFAIAIENTFRSNDIVARLGGDEFTALVRTESDNYPEDIKMRLIRYLEQLNKSSNKGFSIAASLGYIPFKKRENTDLSDILNKADNALYIEKKNKK